jgi:small subunit ribosomal protein S6
MATEAVAQKSAREYETIYVLRQDVDPDAADKVASRVAEVVGRENGTLVKVETWGRRKLAYVVAKQKRGVYYYLKYLGGGAVVTELERNLRMLDTVLKFQTVLLRSDVAVESVTIDPEEVKFARIEAAPEDEKEESREKALGLVDAPETERSRPRADSEFGEELDEGLEGDWTAPVKSEAPAAPVVVAPEAADKEEK